MNLEKVWVKDPKDENAPSVTLTLMVVSFLLVVAVGGLHLAGIVKETSIFLELFYGSLATYLGRRMSFGSKSFGQDKEE